MKQYKDLYFKEYRFIGKFEEIYKAFNDPWKSGIDFVSGFAVMPLTEIDVKRLLIKGNRYKRSVGDGFNVIVATLKDKMKS